MSNFLNSDWCQGFPNPLNPDGIVTIVKQTNRNKYLVVLTMYNKIEYCELDVDSMQWNFGVIYPKSNIL